MTIQDAVWKRANLILAVLIVCINLYVCAAPFAPQISLWQHKQQTKSVGGLPYKTKLAAAAPASNARRAEIPADNRVVIPKLALDEHIWVGKNPYLVNKGVWARPNTSTPPAGSNTVLVGHRFTYDGPATFYSLDKVSVGDAIVVYWAGKEYDYTISQTKVVPPTAVEVEAPTAEPQLTIYTCTPLWSAKNRLVVIAKPTSLGPSHD